MFVACDVCSARQTVDDDRWMQKIPCRACGVPFQITGARTVDTLEEPAEDEQPTQPFMTWDRAVAYAKFAASQVALIAVVGWLVAITFWSPHELAMKQRQGHRGLVSSYQPPVQSATTHQPMAQPAAVAAYSFSGQAPSTTMSSGPGHWTQPEADLLQRHEIDRGHWVPPESRSQAAADISDLPASRSSADNPSGMNDPADSAASDSRDGEEPATADTVVAEHERPEPAHAAAIRRAERLLRMDSPHSCSLSEIENGTVAIKKVSQLKRGQRLFLLWGHSWFRATVIAVRRNEVQISYIGWGSQWDEWVKADRLRIVPAR